MSPSNPGRFTLWANLLLAVLVLAGSSEFLFVAAIGAGVPPLLAAVTSALVNSRHFIFGFALASTLGDGATKWLAAHLINDEAVALALGERTRHLVRVAARRTARGDPWRNRS